MESIVIVGAGPVGLAMACALAQASKTLKIQIIDKQADAVLQNPAIDGRAIALNHLAVAYLKQLGIWGNLDKQEIHPIMDAKVSDGHDPFVLHFERSDDQSAPIGYFVRNHSLRQACYAQIKSYKNIKLLTEQTITGIKTTDSVAAVSLADGANIQANLLIAADGRFSYVRRTMGIGAKMQDFGRVIMAFEMQHTLNHHHTAHEHFLYDQATCAVLPLNGKLSSIVMTMPAGRADELKSMSSKEFNQAVPKYLDNELGEMQLVGERYSYPLIGSFAKQFIKPRVALIGDAAVGMHPVTAHGFNLGLKGTDALTSLIVDAQKHNQDIGSQKLLRKYQAKHRLTAAPLHYGTNAIVGLYNNEQARVARGLFLRVGNY